MSNNAAKNVEVGTSDKVTKATRTEMAERILANKGKFCTTVHIDAQGEERAINFVKTEDCVDIHGYLNVYSIKDADWRKVNTRTLLKVNLENETLELKK